MADFSAKADVLKATIDLIYRHGVRIKTKSKAGETVGNPLPDVPAMLNRSNAWSTSTQSFELSSVFFTVGAGQRKNREPNVKGRGKAAADSYARKHRLDIAVDRLSAVPFSMKADVRYVNWAHVREKLQARRQRLETAYQDLQRNQTLQKQAERRGVGSAEYLANIGELKSKMEEIQDEIQDLLEFYRKTYGKTYFAHFHVYERGSHGKLNRGGPQNAEISLTFDVSHNKGGDWPGVTVVCTWEEHGPLRPTRLAKGTLEFKDGTLVRSKGEIGRVVQKFAKIRPADVRSATPKETYEQVRAQVVATPAWRYLETGTPGADARAKAS